MFLTVAGAGYLSSAVLLLITVGWWGIQPLAAKAATLAFVLAFQFSLNKFVTFAQSNPLTQRAPT